MFKKTENLINQYFNPEKNFMKKEDKTIYLLSFLLFIILFIVTDNTFFSNDKNVFHYALTLIFSLIELIISIMIIYFLTISKYIKIEEKRKKKYRKKIKRKLTKLLKIKIKSNLNLVLLNEVLNQTYNHEEYKEYLSNEKKMKIFHKLLKKESKYL